MRLFYKQMKLSYSLPEIEGIWCEVDCVTNFILNTTEIK